MFWWCDEKCIEDILEESQLLYNSSEEMFKEVLENVDDGSLDEAHAILPTDIGESYLAQCHNIKNDGWRPLNVWMWYTANNDYEVHMVKFSNITATDDSSVPAPDVISLSPLEASCKFWSISSY